jgi:hypothetical protein
VVYIQPFKISLMKKVVDLPYIRVAGAIDDNAIGILDEPPLPQPSGTNHVVFWPFAEGIGTTTLVQRLCGSNPTAPIPSTGINGYRAVWSLDSDGSGSVRYENFFLWDISRDRIDARDPGPDSYVESARVIVAVVPAEGRGLLSTVRSWVSRIGQTQRLIIAITRCDRAIAVNIQPNDVDSLSSELNCAVRQISNANRPMDVEKGRVGNRPTSIPGMDRSVRSLVLAIADCLQRR